MPGQGKVPASRTIASSAGEWRRPATVTREMVRLTSGSADRAARNAGQGGQIFGHDRAAQPGDHQGLDPVFALRGIAHIDLEGLAGAQRFEMVDELAMDAPQIIDAVQGLATGTAFRRSNGVPLGEGDGVALVEQRERSQIVGQVRQADQTSVDLAGAQRFDQILARCLPDANVQIRVLLGAASRRNRPSSKGPIVDITPRSIAMTSSARKPSASALAAAVAA